MFAWFDAVHTEVGESKDSPAGRTVQPDPGRMS